MRHAVVVGAGEVGTHVAELLADEKDMTVSVVDINSSKQANLSPNVDFVRGSGSHPGTLREAGIKKAEMLVAVTANDEVNLIACMLAEQFRGNKCRTIARLEARDLWESEADKLLEDMGVNYPIDPDKETAQEIRKLLTYPGATDVAEMAGKEVFVIGVKLTDDAELTDKTLGEIAEEYGPEWDFLVAAITPEKKKTEKEETTFIPRNNYRLQAGDWLRVVCRKTYRRDLLELLDLQDTTLRRVLLLGGGRTAEIVARQLREEHADVTLIEQKEERAQELSENLDGVMVICGDITDAKLLDDEDVGSYDAVIALTGRDDANILACLFAESRGTKETETIAVVHSLAFRSLLRKHGIDVALSPRTACANAVMQFVRGNSAKVSTFLSGQFEVIELEVQSKADGKQVKNLGLPKDVLVGAYVRDGKAQIGRGHSELRKGDRVVLIARKEHVAEVGRFFT